MRIPGHEEDVIEKLLSPTEVAELLGVTVGYLATRRFERKGPPFVKVGASVRYRTSDVVEWVDANTHNPESRTG